MLELAATRFARKKYELEFQAMSIDKSLDTNVRIDNDGLVRIIIRVLPFYYSIQIQYSNSSNLDKIYWKSLVTCSQ